jgi:hypothetical protein
LEVLKFGTKPENRGTERTTSEKRTEEGRAVVEDGPCGGGCSRRSINGAVGDVKRFRGSLLCAACVSCYERGKGNIFDNQGYNSLFLP